MVPALTHGHVLAESICVYMCICMCMYVCCPHNTWPRARCLYICVCKYGASHNTWSWARCLYICVCMYAHAHNCFLTQSTASVTHGLKTHYKHVCVCMHVYEPIHLDGENCRENHVSRHSSLQAQLISCIHMSMVCMRAYGSILSP